MHVMLSSMNIKISILYGGNLTLENLVNDYEFAKFKPSKFYFSNTSRDLEEWLTNYTHSYLAD